MTQPLPPEIQAFAQALADDRDRQFGTTSPGPTLGDVLRAVEAFTCEPVPWLHRDPEAVMQELRQAVARIGQGLGE